MLTERRKKNLLIEMSIMNGKLSNTISFGGKSFILISYTIMLWKVKVKLATSKSKVQNRKCFPTKKILFTLGGYGGSRGAGVGGTAKVYKRRWIKNSVNWILLIKKRADTAQTHGPPRSVKTSFLLQNAYKQCCSLPTAVPGLRRGWDMFVFVCSVESDLSQSVSQ